MPTDAIIYAPATASGRAGIAVLRVSGASLAATFDGLSLPRLEPRRATLHDWRDSKSGETIDRCLLVFFPSPASFTGEDVLEFHLHGGRAVMAEALAALARLPGHRLAEPGEFTRRAFENGKLDLAEAEGLIDLIDADTAAQKKQALRQMEGALSGIAADLRQRLLRCLAFIEALIDFPDEDIPGETLDRVDHDIEQALNEITGWLASARYGEGIRDGFRVTILGLPNAGKSTLLNVLAQREAAIVSSIAGTTRDRIEVKLDIHGLPVWLSDTAGLRPAGDAIEEEGIRRAIEHAERSDIRLLLLDATRPLSEQSEILGHAGPPDIVVIGKSDLGIDTSLQAVESIRISAFRRQGLDSLSETLHKRLSALLAAEHPVLTRERHRMAFAASETALLLARGTTALELKAEYVGFAASSLASIIGRIDVEALLDMVFESFCLGK